MATYLGTKAVFQVMHGATAGNLGGAGFNPLNANFPTDGVISGGTGNTATLTPTSSYAPSSADNNAWAFFPVQSGVTYPTWYQITSATGGVATLNTAIGAGVQIVNNRYVPNAAAGFGSATPTLTYGIDYSQQTAAQYTATTGTTVVSGTTFADGVTFTVGKNWIGNFIAISATTGGTAGWYEIVNETSGTATLDRSAGAGTSVHYYLGGAVSLNGSTTGITDDVFFALGAGATTTGCRFFIQGNGSYSLSASTTTLVGNAAWPVIIEGYNSVRGDRPSIASGAQPNITNATFNQFFTIGDYTQVYSISSIGTNSNYMISLGSSIGYSQLINCKAINKSVNAGIPALGTGTGNCHFIGCEAVSYNGTALDTESNTNVFIIGCYIHDSTIGINLTTVNNAIINCIISSCFTENIISQERGNLIYGNTIYGGENKNGIGVAQPYTSNTYLNNIFYGFASGYGGTDTEYCGYSNYNCFYNNTANISSATTGAFLGANDITTANPSFTNVYQVISTAGTSSAAGSILSDTTQNFIASSVAVVSSRDFVFVTAGSSNLSSAVGVFGITSVSSNSLTLDHALNTASGGTTISYRITAGRNWLPTGAV